MNVREHHDFHCYCETSIANGRCDRVKRDQMISSCVFLKSPLSPVHSNWRERVPNRSDRRAHKHFRSDARHNSFTITHRTHKHDHMTTHFEASSTGAGCCSWSDAMGALVGRTQVVIALKNRSPAQRQRSKTTHEYRIVLARQC